VEYGIVTGVMIYPLLTI